MTTHREPAGLTPADHAAMMRAVERLRLHPDPGRREQIELKLRDDHPSEVGEFASFSCQIDALKLGPREAPPCCYDPACLDAIIAANDSGWYSAAGAKLAKRMLRAGLSRYEPDPLEAVLGAKR